MKPTTPYVDEDKQVIFVELENETLHNVVNGLIFGLVTGTLLVFLLDMWVVA